MSRGSLLRQLLVPRSRAAQPERRRLNIERKGAPRPLRGNSYYNLIEGSWPRLGAVFVLLFMGMNAVFAGFYQLQEGSLSGNGSFLDAFFFSVQTVSTIGYGAIAPQTLYANVLVTLEVVLGLTFAALTTGLVFAKVSRPEAGVLFSAPLTVTDMDGVPTLCLRVGNTRTSEVVDASVHVSVLMDHTTSEGHRLRRVVDLPLVRSHTPIFALTWTVMHRIDEQSPLRDCDWTRPEQFWSSIVVTLGGHEATYAQTVYDRHLYYPDDVRFRHVFEDVLEFREGRHLVVDYGRFHNTCPEGEHSAER